MSEAEHISDEQLNALLDNELDAEARALVLSTIANDPQIKQRYDDLRQVKNMMVMAYREVPQPRSRKAARRFSLNPALLGSASAALLLLGIVSGWLMNAYTEQSPNMNFQDIEQLGANKVDDKKILLHISTTDNKRVQAALDTAENLLQRSRDKHSQLDLEIVANAEGLNILRMGSPYAKQIRSLTNNYSNVSFLACGIAKQTAALKEGKPIELLPEAKDIPAALDEILNKLQRGWTYVHG